MLVRALKLKKQEESVRKIFNKPRKRSRSPGGENKRVKVISEEPVGSDLRTPARQTSVEYGETSRMLQMRCVSPRLGASRVKTPPPTGLQEDD